MKQRVNQYITGILTIISLTSLASCSPNLLQTANQNIHNLDVFVKDGSLEATYINKNNNKFCLEPMVDTVHTEKEGLSLGLNSTLNSESVGFGQSEGAISLGGMSPEVLLASQLLYRACELSLNLNADQNLTLEIYSRFLNTLEKVSLSTGNSEGTRAISSFPDVSTDTDITEAQKKNDAPIETVEAKEKSTLEKYCSKHPCN